MFFIFRFIIVWTIWFIFADKKRWRELFTIAFFASAIGSTTDHLMHYFKFWSYKNSLIDKFIINVIDDWGIYIVATYLFIQWYPEARKIQYKIMYWILWTTTAITIEIIHIMANQMAHYNGWTLFHSYIADWILFWVFYKIHKVFKYERLSE
ncbi:CBO0543 family protein [Sporosalibacterium faouarense]|uniref:CBO0543 family protein n=1 Tax=Sporosalibacterium faouarense TaxID=516123 RepID=UPI00141D28DC|nr:CBO0543 family protein [Sporosalibacterium faouarense]MTI47833.1 hypothetical protein [Bacillota bacterium]